jgi:hypothetical protein
VNIEIHSRTDCTENINAHDKARFDTYLASSPPRSTFLITMDIIVGFPRAKVKAFKNETEVVYESEVWQALASTDRQATSHQLLLTEVRSFHIEIMNLSDATGIAQARVAVAALPEPDVITRLSELA